MVPGHQTIFPGLKENPRFKTRDNDGATNSSGKQAHSTDYGEGFANNETTEIEGGIIES